MKLGLRALRGTLVVALLTTVTAPVVAGSASAVAPSGAPTLLAPAAGEPVGGNPVLSWTPVAGAVKYRVEVSTTEAFTNVPVYKQDTYNVQATPQKALPVGTLYWRVAGLDGANAAGPFAVGSFARTWSDAPTAVAPADGDTLTYPTEPLLFTWQPQTGAQKYNVQIDDDVNFISPLVSTSTNNPAYTLTNPQTNGQQFFWRVQGVADGVLSPWSTTRTYYVEWPATPVLTSPEPGDTVTDVVLEWSPVEGATTYQVQVSANEDFSNNMAIDVVTKSTRYAPNDAKFLLNGAYYWRVRARDADPVPNLGGWSATVSGLAGDEPAYFIRAWNERPTLQEPAHETSVATPTMSWTAVPHASHYEIQLGGDSTFSPGSYASCVTNQTSFTPYALFDSPVSYTVGGCDIGQGFPPLGEVVYWRVRGMDNAGTKTVEGLFSEPFAFAFQPTAIPAAIAPAHLAEVAVPTLRWSPVAGVSRYRVTILTETGSNAETPVTTFSTSYTPDDLTPGKAYRWYVQTVDDMDRVGPRPLPQGYRSFTYAPATAVLGYVDVLTPADGASSPIMPEMSWSPVVDATTYSVYYRQKNFTTYTLLGSTKASSFTLTGLPPTAATYQWFVNPLDDQGNALDAVPPVREFTLENIPLVTGLSPQKCTELAPCVATGETPRLSWDPTPHTGDYLVYLANDASFTSRVRTYQTQYTTLTPRESLMDSAADKAYYWFVRPCRTGTLRCGQFDNATFPSASAFRKQSLPVQLLAPAEGAVVPAAGAPGLTPVAFTWAEYLGTTSDNVPSFNQGAKRYRLDVASNKDFSPLVDSVVVDQTTYTPWDKTYPEGPLFWRVTAIDASNNALTTSETRMVTKSTPALQTLYPADGDVVGGTPYFRWTAQPHVKQYDLEVALNGDEQFSSLASLGITSAAPPRLPAYAPTISLKAGDYAWRVRRVDADGRPGPWTVGGVFTVAPGAAELLTPATGVTVNDDATLFTWSPVERAAKYLFESSYTQAFTALIESKTVTTTVMTAWAPTARYADGTVYWRVKALDASGQEVSISEVRSLVKDATAPSVKAKAPIASVPVSGAAFTVEFTEPVKGVSASTFTLKVAASGTSIPATVTPDATSATTAATLKPTGLLVPGETYTVALTDGITDLNGNPLKPFSWSARTALVVDGASPAVQEFWDRDTSTSASGGGYLASRTPGAKVSYTFSGTSASILGRRAPDGGYADVYLDGVRQGTVSFYSSTVRWKQVVWSKSGLAADKAHTVELRALGTKPAAASSAWAYPDAFRYGAFSVEETSPLVTQSFRAVGLAGALGGSYLLESHAASGDTGAQPYAQMVFKGTGVSWKGIRSTSGGVAKVYVDGVLKATIDTYGTASSSGQTLWSVSGLPSKTHTVKVVVTGARRSTSKGYNVTIDSFSVV